LVTATGRPKLQTLDVILTAGVFWLWLRLNEIRLRGAALFFVFLRSSEATLFASEQSYEA
jgi:hypothetical protein